MRQIGPNGVLSLSANASSLSASMHRCFGNRIGKQIFTLVRKPIDIFWADRLNIYHVVFPFQGLMKSRLEEIRRNKTMFFSLPKYTITNQCIVCIFRLPLWIPQMNSLQIPHTFHMNSTWISVDLTISDIHFCIDFVAATILACPYCNIISPNLQVSAKVNTSKSAH